MKRHYLVVIALVLGMMIMGCASYQGSADYDVPFSEQATLMIPGTLSAVSYDGDRVFWSRALGEKFGGNLYINIPAGKHSFTFNYLSISEYSSGNYTYQTTSSASGMTATGDFKAGNTYKAQLMQYSGNRVEVQIALVKQGTPKDSFQAPESQILYELGMTSTSDLGIHMGFKSGMVFNNVTRMAWNIESGFGFGTDVAFKEFGLDVYTGANYEVYLNKKGTVGLSVGGGVVWPIGPLYPYAKISVPFVLGGAKLGLYGTFYLTDLVLYDPEFDLTLFNQADLKKFGFGAFFSY